MKNRHVECMEFRLMVANLTPEELAKVRRCTSIDIDMSDWDFSGIPEASDMYNSLQDVGDRNLKGFEE